MAKFRVTKRPHYHGGTMVPVGGVIDLPSDHPDPAKRITPGRYLVPLSAKDPPNKHTEKGRVKAPPKQ